MASFVLIPTDPDNADLDEALRAQFGNAAYRLPRGEWLVSYEGTSKQLTDMLGISEGKLGTVVALNFSGYWGRASKDIWEWLKENTR